jgi:hypothetical protein
VFAGKTIAIGKVTKLIESIEEVTEAVEKTSLAA